MASAQEYRSLKIFSRLIGLALVAGLSLTACNTGAVTTQPLTDGGRTDAPHAGGSGYTYVALIDVERLQKSADFSCKDSQGPGADIDAVALIRQGEVIGYGLVGSALYHEVKENQCGNDDCPDGDCKYTSLSESLNPTDLINATLGPPDVVVNKDGDDKGYLSLNGGILQLRIGNKEGKAPGQAIRSGDQIKVFEVDWTRKTDSNGCVCAPEKYQVVLQDANKADIPLKPSQFDKANAGVCGSSPGSDEAFGCGTSVFDVL